MDGEQQIRAAALEAASRIVSENLAKFVSLGLIDKNKTHTKLVTIDLAKGFEQYIRDGG
jgi:hypothetical protein